jgi:cytochrome c-type biogenesis protein CcmH/NrfG
MATAPKSGTKWTNKQAYALAVICLLVGIPVGYLLGGPSTRAANPAVQNALRPAPGVAPGDQVTPAQLKHMADVQAEPLLATLQKDPNNADLLAQIGSLYFRTQQFPIAVEYYSRAAKIKPTAEVLVSLSNSYHYAGSDDLAMEALNRALQIDPKSADALFNLGMLKWQVKNDPEGAVQAWQRLLETNPNHPRRAEVESMIARAKQHMNLPANAKTDKPIM